MASGGYRKPANPAPVSGPGALSKRTDTGPKQVLSAATGQDYGDHKAQIDAERTAPMAGTAPAPTAQLPGGAPAGPAGGGGTPYAGGDFAGPTTRPGEPITHGVDIGPGAGSSALTFNPQAAGAVAKPTGAMTNMLRKLSSTDTTGVIGQLYQAALAKGV